MKYTKEQIENILKIYPSVEEMERVYKLNNARKFLNDTDYIANKIVEYQILGKELEQDYTEILNKREEARETIRNLEDKR